MLLAAASPISFAAWMSLLDNFAIHEAAFTGREIGILQSLREIWIPRICGRIRVAADARATLAYVSLLALGVGALTGWFPNVLGLYITTVVMSIGFHYYETVASSLALQWIDKELRRACWAKCWRRARQLQYSRLRLSGWHSSFWISVTRGLIWRRAAPRL